MADNARIAEAMGWEKIIEPPFSPRWIRLIGEGRPAPTGASITHIYEGEAYAEVFGGPPDYFTDPALLGEMLDWLGKVSRSDHNFCGYTLQRDVARCVLWALGFGAGANGLPASLRGEQGE